MNRRILEHRKPSLCPPIFTGAGSNVRGPIYVARCTRNTTISVCVESSTKISIYKLCSLFYSYQLTFCNHIVSAIKNCVASGIPTCCREKLRNAFSVRTQSPTLARTHDRLTTVPMISTSDITSKLIIPKTN